MGSGAARFVLPPAKLGVVYALKGLARVRSRVGEQAARRMFLLGASVDAAEAKSLGLLDVISDDAASAAASMCEVLATNAPLAVRGMKRGMALLDAPSLEGAAAYELLRRESFNSEDAREGRDASLDSPHARLQTVAEVSRRDFRVNLEVAARRCSRRPACEDAREGRDALLARAARRLQRSLKSVAATFARILRPLLMVHVSLSREDAQLQRAPATFAISLRPALLLLGSLNGEELAGSQTPRDFARSLKRAADDHCRRVRASTVQPDSAARRRKSRAR